MVTLKEILKEFLELIFGLMLLMMLLERMPLLKAAYISLAIAGNSQNKDYEVSKFIKEYVENKINHQSIVDPKIKSFKRWY